jgi:hypothetical protein
MCQYPTRKKTSEGKLERREDPERSLGERNEGEITIEAETKSKRKNKKASALVGLKSTLSLCKCYITLQKGPKEQSLRKAATQKRKERKQGGSSGVEARLGRNE